MSSAVEEGGHVGREAGRVRVRFSRASDRPALLALGHPPPVAAALSPSAATRLAWALTGLKARALLAEVVPTGSVLGSVQFVRSRGDSGTWMFGHWRVAPQRRRRGIGRLLIDEGLRLLPAIRRLYSYVDWGNEVSVEAHLRLGFEAAAEIQGSAPLGALSAIGPAAPAVRLVPADRSAARELAELYRKAMGPLWFRLFPGDDRNFSPALGTGTEGPALLLLRALREGPARILLVADAGPPSGVVVWRRAAPGPTLFADPARCDAALLARLAARLMAQGAARGLDLTLRGLPTSLLASPGPIAARILMGLPEARGRNAGASDIRTGSKEPAPKPEPPSLPSPPCGRR